MGSERRGGVALHCAGWIGSFFSGQAIGGECGVECFQTLFHCERCALASHFLQSSISRQGATAQWGVREGAVLLCTALVGSVHFLQGKQ